MTCTVITMNCLLDLGISQLKRGSRKNGRRRPDQCHSVLFPRRRFNPPFRNGNIKFYRIIVV
uniref:Uncharacterized protein n=1 Tax=Rhizophora mucronata TaxID=61149 RepID=A0A2P2J5Y2_RHIMU